MLFKMMDHFVSSVRLIIPKVLVNLKPDTDIPHHQFKVKYSIFCMPPFYGPKSVGQFVIVDK